MTNTIASSFRIFRTGLILAVSIGLFLLTVLWERSVINIPPGHAGVMWWRFFGGTDVKSPARGEGIRIIFPWDRLYIYDMRLQDHSTNYEAISSEGLAINVSASMRWRLIPNSLGKLHKTIGPNYIEKLLIPEIGSILRAKIATEEAEKFYAQERIKVQSSIYSGVTDRENSNGIGARHDSGGEVDPSDVIEMIDVLIRHVELPLAMKEAIERKLQEAELVKEYAFKVEREKLESKRKEVEASGIKKFQQIVSPGMSDNYLRWQGINATLAIAKSQNGKLVIMGNGPGGLPVILNGFDSKNGVTPDTKPSAILKDLNERGDNQKNSSTPIKAK